MNLVRRPRLLVLGTDTADKDRVETFVDAIAKCGIDGTSALSSRVEEVSEILASKSPDLVFSTAFKLTDRSGHRFYSCDIMHRSGVAWIGSESDVLELVLAKSRIKERWRNEGIATPEWLVVRRAEDGSLENIELLENVRGFPYIVKPDGEGNSRGIDQDSVVRTPLELYARASSVADRYGKALVERFVGSSQAREFTVAMIGNGERAVVSAVEIIKPRNGTWVVTQDAKDNHLSVVAPIEDPRLRKRIERFAHRAFMSASVKDYARCDLILDGDTLHAIEINGQPMVPDRWFETCAAAAGLDDRQYLQAIVFTGILRLVAERQVFMRIPKEMEQALPRTIVHRLEG